MPANDSTQQRPSPTSGWIDIHSHLLPGIDDGCADLNESVACVRRLLTAGFTGSICTPHLSPHVFPDNTPRHVTALVEQFRRQLAEQGIDYPIWPGGELRLEPDVIDWVKEHGVRPLAGSRCVLMDIWGGSWPKWSPAVFEWFLGQGYQPVLAHPERMTFLGDPDKSLRRLEAMGVWLQVNLRSFTGEEGYLADQWARRLLDEGRVRFLALDMHGPDSLEGRLDGLRLVESEFGPEALDDLLAQAPRRVLLKDESA